MLLFMLTGALGNTEDHRGVALLSGLQNGFGPFEVVDVELAHRIMALKSLGEHVLCRYEHG